MTRFFSKGLLGLALAAVVAGTAAPVFAGGLLVVAPHPDDDLLIAAGVIASAKARGEQVKVVFMTNGDFSGPTEGAIRQIEAVNAQIENLGTTEDDLIFLGYPDGSLQHIATNYPNAGDQYFSGNGQSVTYGTRGLGRADYHSYHFGQPGAYNRANIVADLQSIVSTFKPDHILTTAEFDQHSDHSTTYTLVAAAADAASSALPGYHPTIHKTVVWNDHVAESPIWPEVADPSSYHVAPPILASTSLLWSDRESLDVPLAMQSTELATNPKYIAIQDHVSQGGVDTILGRFLHKDEIFWVESTAGGSLPPRVDAGNGQVVSAGASVTLNGSGSASRSGGGLIYQWRQTTGAPVLLLNSVSATPTFIAPAGAAGEDVLTFELTVADSQKTSLPDTVVVTVLADVPNSFNIAPQATVTASSQNTADSQFATNAVDGVADGYPGDFTREWATAGQRTGAWIRLEWNAAATINKVVLFDRPNLNDFITGGVLTFSDGSSVPVGALNNGGAGLEVRFAPKHVTWATFTVTSTSGSSENVGLAELQVFGVGGGAQLPNEAPVANAGANQTVAAGSTVQLSGTGSQDPEGQALGYHWRQISGSSVTLSSETSATPTFSTPANLAQNAVYGFELVVDDGVHESAPATVQITVIAAVQASQNVAPQAAVTASSQNSADGQLAIKAVDEIVDGFPGNYTREWATNGQRAGAWIELNWAAPQTIDRVVLFDRPNGDDHIQSATLTFSDGSSVNVGALNNDGTATAVTFSARTVTSVRLTVASTSASSLNVGLAELQVFTVGSAPANQAPVANAGTAQTVMQGDLVQISGQGSSDPESAALTYHWRQIGGPAVTLSSTDEVAPLFVAPTGLTQNAVLSFELIVNDGQSDSAPAVATVTVLGTTGINIAPQASVLVSSENPADGQTGVKAVDTVISGYPGDYTREWATAGQRVGAWIELRWTAPMNVNRVVLYDRPNSNDHIQGATLTFSDGSSVTVPALNNNGTASFVNFSPKTVTSIRLAVDAVGGASENIGLSEFEVFGSPAN